MRPLFRSSRSLRASRLRRYAALLALAVLLSLAFMAYLRPEFMLDVANRIMLCF